MTNRLMMSVAAIALLAGTGFANAQGTGGKETGGAAGGAAVQQSAPPAAAGAAGGATMQNHESTAPSAPGGMKSTQSEPKTPAAAPKTQRADDSMGNQKSKGMSSENETKGPAKDMKAEGRDNDMKPGGMKAEGRDNTARDNNMKAEGKNDSMKADGKAGNMNAETKGTEKSQATTGMAGAGAKISTEQRTQITSVIREQHVAPITNVNFSISIGTRIPREVSFHPLPAQVVTIYPEWRGYDYILVRDQILVIDPRSHEIVAVLDV